MKKIRVVAYGVGVVGSLIVKSLLEKDGVEIVGAIDIAANKVGKDLGDALDLGRKLGITISNDTSAVLSSTQPDIVIHTTSSYLKDIFPQVTSIVETGVDVVSTCEELSYPYLVEPELASRLDALAKKYNATVLGTGINPGFLMDTLVIALTAPCQKIKKISVARVMNAATRRVPFQKKIGAGLTVQEFKFKIDKKEITGHVGLQQSIGMVADALSWKLDRIVTEPVQPIIARMPVGSKDIKVKAGQVAGLRQRAIGILNTREVIILDFQAYIGAEEEYDSITVQGVPPINQRIQPCVHGDLGTIAMVMNSVPRVISAPSGLLTMKDLPIPRAAFSSSECY